MIIKNENLRIETRENMRSGNGKVVIRHLNQTNENAPQQIPELKHTRLLAELTLAPAASIGNHTHFGETEYYMIQKGEGRVSEKDGEKDVCAGDVVVTGDGQSHSIINTGSENLVLYALIILD